MKLRRPAAAATAVLCLIAASWAPPAAAVDASPTLGPGWWSGAYLTSSSARDAGTLLLHIAADGTASGTIDVAGLAEAAARREGVKLSFSGELRVAGTASDVQADGRVKLRGRTKIMGLSIPVKASVPANATLTPVATGCSMATADLSASAELPSQAAAYDTSATAKAILRRTDKRPTRAEVKHTSDRLAAAFIEAGDDVKKASTARPKIGDLRTALTAIQRLFAATTGPTPCPAPSDTELQAAFADAVLTLMNGERSNADLLAALQMSARLGLLSDTSSAGAARLRSVFKPALAEAIDKADDADTKARLQVAATQYGFGDLL